MFTNIASDIARADMVIVTVPTPVNENNDPDYSPLIDASELIEKI
jgi:UDP-N-acetyl-D-galactosamine dehydrogenase